MKFSFSSLSNIYFSDQGGGVCDLAYGCQCNPGFTGPECQQCMNCFLILKFKINLKIIF